ncbi:MAG: von Willebrand factor type A domain-containing protein, partial [Verrucomicrobiota bacterium]|nr:von Willebrand factor type A domain-containing protein [Verrucomicrobiota bacterium]
FRKGLAIAAAVCAVLLVAAALLLPRLVKSNTDLLVAANSKPAELFGEPVEAEEELRVDVAGVENYARVEGVQLADEMRSTDQSVPVSESAPAPFGDHSSGKVDFLAGGIVADREGTVLYDESIEQAAPVPAEADRLTAATGMAHARGLGLGTISGKAADGRLVLGEQWSEPAPGQGKPIGGRNESRARNRPQIASKRELADLYFFQNKAGGESGEPPASAAGEPASGSAEFNFATPSPNAATMSGTGRLSIDSLHSISEAGRSGADELFKKATLPGPAAPPTPLAGDAGIVGENRNQLALPGGMGGMGIGGGGFIAGAYADGLDVGQPVANGGVAAGPVSGGVAGVPVSDLDADGGGEIRVDGKLYGFRGDQAAQDSAKTLGAKANRRYSGRSALESVEGESVVLGQALNIAAAGEVASESLNGQIVRGLAADKSGQLVERGQSDVEPLYFQSELSRAEPAALARGAVALGVVEDDEVAKESDQAEAPALGDVPALGRMFKRGADPEEVARDLSAAQLERSADTKARSERGRASGESARQSPSLAKQDKDRLTKLPVEEYESLLAPGSDQQQRLAAENRNKSRKSPATRQPKSSATANRELLLRKGKLAANKKLPTPAAKPQSASRSSRLRGVKREEKQLVEKLKEAEPPAKPPSPSVVYTPRPETVTAENNFSTFSLNVTDVSFKTTLASLQAGKLPEPGNVRSEEFLNALEYRDPMPRAGEPMAFHWERSRSPFTHDRDIIRFAVRTAALGRQPGRAVNLVCLLDNSGSMEREDRVSIVRQSLDVLARKLTPNDRVSLITFSRTPELRIDGMRGGNPEAFLKASTGWIPQGGTHVEKALALAYETAKKHFIAGGNNRVILLTDGAANMGNVDPYQLRKIVESHRKQGVALDCFGIGWEDYNDNLLEALSRNGDGRYGFLNEPAQAVAEFEQKLLGAFQVAASDVKVQVEWNADRVKVFRQVGYLRHQLKKEDFRNNKIDAAEISAAESGNALYVVQVNPNGEGPLGMVRVRYKVPFTSEYTEMEWSLAYEPAATPLEQASPAMRLGCVAATFAEWLAQNPYAQGVQLVDLQGLISGIPSIYGTDPRPTELEWMIGKASILAGN